MIKINGSHLEGGGQILRTAVALSALTGKSFEIINIRAGREKTRGEGGMKEQHVQAVKAIKKLCNANVEGLELGSKKLIFEPGEITKKKLNIKIGTAGSTSLVLQALILASLNKSKESLIQVDIEGGGTWNKWAPSVEYLKNIFCGFFHNLGLDLNVEVLKEGFYPRGGARIRAQWKCTKLKGVDLSEKGDLRFIRGVSVASSLLRKAKVAERQSDAVRRILGKNFACKISMGNKYVDSSCAGSGVLVVGEFDDYVMGFDVVGEKGKQAEVVGRECAEGFINQVKMEGCVDEKLFDQILPFLALAKDNSKIKYGRMTKHAETNMWVVKNFLNVDFRVSEEKRMVEVVI